MPLSAAGLGELLKLDAVSEQLNATAVQAPGLEDPMRLDVPGEDSAAMSKDVPFDCIEGRRIPLEDILCGVEEYPCVGRMTSDSGHHLSRAEVVGLVVELHDIRPKIPQQTT